MWFKFLAWLFDWEVVALQDHDGEIVIRRVKNYYGVRQVTRMFGNSMLTLHPGGRVTGNIYTLKWWTVRHKKRGLRPTPNKRRPVRKPHPNRAPTKMLLK